MKGFIIAIVIILILVAVIVSCYNKLVKQRILTEEAFSTMDVYLKRDLISFRILLKR